MKTLFRRTATMLSLAFITAALLLPMNVTAQDAPTPQSVSSVQDYSREAAGTTCNCSVTGQCTCAPDKCLCTECPQGRANLVKARSEGRICNDCWRELQPKLASYSDSRPMALANPPAGQQVQVVQAAPVRMVPQVQPYVSVQQYSLPQVSYVQTTQQYVSAAPAAPTMTVRSTAGGFVASSNVLDHRGRRVVQYSGGRYERGLARHTVKGIRRGYE